MTPRYGCCSSWGRTVELLLRCTMIMMMLTAMRISAVAHFSDRDEFWVVLSNNPKINKTLTLEMCRKLCAPQMDTTPCNRSYVATISTAAENDRVSALLPSIVDSAMLGGVYTASSPVGKVTWTEGPLKNTVVWSDGKCTPGMYCNFRSEEPSSGSSEVLFTMYGPSNTLSGGPSSAGYWHNNADNGYTNACVCRRPQSWSCSISLTATDSGVPLSRSVTTTPQLSTSIGSDSASQSLPTTMTQPLSVTQSLSESDVPWPTTITATRSNNTASNTARSGSAFPSLSSTSSRSRTGTGSYTLTTLSIEKSHLTWPLTITRPTSHVSQTVVSLSESRSVSSTTSPSLDAGGIILTTIGAFETAVQTSLGVVTSVSVATSGGGDVSAAVSLVMLSVASCRGTVSSSQQLPSAAPSVTQYLISPFWRLGSLWMAAGNLCLVCTVCGVHALWVLRVAVVKMKTTFSIVATGSARFPALTLMLADFLLPGAAMGAVQTIVDDHHGASSSSSASVAAAVVVLVLVCASIVASIVFTQSVLVPRSSWVAYRHLPVSWDVVLYPSGRWAPKAVRNSFGPLLGSVTRRWAVWGSVDRVVAIILAALCGLQGNRACQPLLLLVAVLCFLRSVASVALRPFRLPMNAVVVPVASAVFGAVCVLKYVDANGSYKDSTSTTSSSFSIADAVRLLQIFQAVLQMWRVWWEMWIAYREARWDLDHEGALQGAEANAVASAVATAVWFGGGGGTRDVVAAAFLEIHNLLLDEDGSDTENRPDDSTSLALLLMRHGDATTHNEGGQGHGDLDAGIQEVMLLPINVIQCTDKTDNAWRVDEFDGIEGYFLKF